MPYLEHGLAGPVLSYHASPAGLGGEGFGLPGHYSPVPVQTVKLIGIPQPVPVRVPQPVDQPYLVPVPRAVPLIQEKTVLNPYISKVIQPQIHKQTVISSHVLPTHK